eukprot:UN04171
MGGKKIVVLLHRWDNYQTTRIALYEKVYNQTAEPFFSNIDMTMNDDVKSIWIFLKTFKKLFQRNTVVY